MFTPFTCFAPHTLFRSLPTYSLVRFCVPKGNQSKGNQKFQELITIELGSILHLQNLRIQLIYASSTACTINQHLPLVFFFPAQ